MALDSQLNLIAILFSCNDFGQVVQTLRVVIETLCASYFFFRFCVTWMNIKRLKYNFQGGGTV